MKALNSFGKWWIKKRMSKIEFLKSNPLEIQQQMLHSLVSTAKNTEYGRRYAFKHIKTIREFQEHIPLNTYDDLFPYIRKLLNGEKNILWPSSIKWFAKSSGTSSKSKLIPVSEEGLKSCHYRGGKDMLALYASNYPDTKIFSGKNLSIGGSQENNFSDNAAHYGIGNISGITMQNLPSWAQYSRTPGLKVTMMNNWEEKIERIAEITQKQKVASMAGNPMWLLILLHHMLEKNKGQYIQDIWPEMEVFFHGGVSFTPYQQQFQQIDRDKRLRYMNIYNATEGFFGLQDSTDKKELLLMLNHGTFYEFIPAEDFQSTHPKVVDLSGVEEGKYYSVIISTNSGLWRYRLGDTIKFTSTNPFRMVISGRTNQCINVFGEDLFVEQAEMAISAACDKTNALLENFTVAPRYYNGKLKGCHEWLIEFTIPPHDLTHFTGLLDEFLQSLNEDYAAKRKLDTAIEKPVVHEVKPGTFYAWLKKNNKLGGQYKVPRLSNSRIYLEEILEQDNEGVVHV